MEAYAPGVTPKHFLGLVRSSSPVSLRNRLLSPERQNQRDNPPNADPPYELVHRQYRGIADASRVCADAAGSGGGAIRQSGHAWCVGNCRNTRG